MWSSVFLSLILPLAFALSITSMNTEHLHSAPVIFNNPQGAAYEATFFEKSNTTIRGWVTAWAPSSGVGVKIHADLWGLPDDDGAYKLHISELPINADAENCYMAGGHLDPYRRGNEPPCNPSRAQTCQVGDLSGKHGPIFVVPNEAFEIEYTDFFLSTDPKSPAFFGNRSLVLHDADGESVNCANFVRARG